MIPLRDDIPASRRPIVNYVLIAICSLVFLLQVAQADEGAQTVERFGMIPARVLHPGDPVTVTDRRVEVTPYGRYRIVETERPAAPSPIPAWLTVLTCIFLHGGWLHVLGNMWFLWIFGDNVEDRLGRLGYLVFYLGTGVAASLAHLATNPGSSVPTVGASGAIAGVMGAYLLLYPRARVLTLVPIFFFLHIVVLPASLFLGIWILFQLLQGTLAIGSIEAGGVAWWAHIGGFAAGAGVVWLLRRRGRLRPAIQARRAAPGRIHYHTIHRRRLPPGR